jgi:hypothetical protein
VTEEIDLETRLAAAITDPDFEKLELAMREPDIFRALGNSCATYLLTAGRRDAHCLTRI